MIPMIIPYQHTFPLSDVLAFAGEKLAVAAGSRPSPPPSPFSGGGQAEHAATAHISHGGPNRGYHTPGEKAVQRYRPAAVIIVSAGPKLCAKDMVEGIPPAHIYQRRISANIHTIL